MPISDIDETIDYINKMVSKGGISEKEILSHIIGVPIDQIPDQDKLNKSIQDKSFSRAVVTYDGIKD